ncbi:MAG: sel1 repeat family protein, partial [Campylobacteraceae bacterium]|nr:sel1 repeat family protein [Campylobacteraceae bacterium]
MSKIRKIFWTVSLVTIILIVCLDLFYFGFKNTKARECGNAIMQSCYELGFAYHNEIEGVKKDTATALKYLEKACNGKYAQGCQYLGMITADSQKSVNYYDSACDYGSLDSCYTLGLLYENQTMKNLSKSLSYFINLCEQNYKNSCFRTALLYSKYDAPNDIKDYKKALSIFDNFCDKNDYASCYAAGWMYYDGKIESLEKIAKSMDYFTKSCEGGYVYGCYSIDMHERELKKFEENQRLCDNGSAEHCNKVAYEYKRGRTVQNNLTKAA